MHTHSSMNNPGTITPKMIASSAVNGMPSSFLKNVVKIFFIALYILIVKLLIQKPREPHGWRGKNYKKIIIPTVFLMKKKMVTSAFACGCNQETNLKQY